MSFRSMSTTFFDSWHSSLDFEQFGSFPWRHPNLNSRLNTHSVQKPTSPPELSMAPQLRSTNLDKWINFSKRFLHCKISLYVKDNGKLRNRQPFCPQFSLLSHLLLLLTILIGSQLWVDFIILSQHWASYFCIFLTLIILSHYFSTLVIL